MKVILDYEQFIDWKYSNKSLLEIKLENIKSKKNIHFEKKLVYLIAAALFLSSYSSPVTAADEIEKINEMGNEILYYIRQGGKWIFILCGSIEIIKSGMKKGSVKEEAPQILIRYGLLYGCLYAITIIFKYIEKILG